MKYLLFILSATILFSGCERASTRNTDSGVPNVATEIKEISPREAQVAVAKAYSQFIDVRTSEEYAAGHAARSENIPLDTLSASFDKLQKSEPVYIICQTGNRSKTAADMLKKAGFNNVLNVTGGTVAWQADGLPLEIRPPHNLPPPKNSNGGS